MLVTDLQQVGAIVDEVAVYYTFPAASHDAQGLEVLRLLRNHQLDIVTFTSSSTVRNFVAWLKCCEVETEDTRGEGVCLFSDDGKGLAPSLRQTQIASIGPITSQTARQLGLHVDIEAKEFTIAGLVDAIIQHEELS